MGNYATVSQVKTFKVGGEIIDVSAYTDPEIETDIGLAESFIESITGDVFYSASQLMKFDGSGHNTLFFTPLTKLRLVGLDSIYIYREDQVTLWYTPVENDDFIRYPYYLKTHNPYGNSPREIFGRSGWWPKGLSNIWITGHWGHAAVPPEITRAAILLTAERLMPGCTLMAPKDISQAMWSDFTVMFKSAPEAVGQTTGYSEVDRLLAGYVNYTGMFQAVPDNKQLHDGKNIRIVGR